MSNTSNYVGTELESMSFAKNYHQWIIDELTPYIGQNAVEVGAGVGELTTLLLQTKLEHLYAFEPASNLFPTLNEKMQGESRVSTVNEFFKHDLVPDVIDSVMYINVLEHIEDESSELLMAHRTLKPGGYLLIFIPALPWLFSEADRKVGHFRRYYKKDLIKLVEKAGFSIQKARYFDIAGILPWYVNFVLMKNSFNSSSVALYDKLVVPPMRVLEKMLTPPIGKNILLIAKKSL